MMEFYLMMMNEYSLKSSDLGYSLQKINLSFPGRFDAARRAGPALSRLQQAQAQKSRAPRRVTKHVYSLRFRAPPRAPAYQ
jgi:hypothetical protein